MGLLPDNGKRLWQVFLFVCLAYYAVMVSFHIKNPFMFDEVLNSGAAKMIINTGRPLIYYWSGGNQPNAHALAHPALYINSLALAYSLGGSSELTAYLFGVICALATMFLIMLISRLLFKEKKKGYITGVISGCLYLTNPLLVRGSLVADIDTTILITLVILFAFLAIRSFVSRHKNDVLFLSLVFSLCLWAKETTSALLIPAVFIYLFLSEYRRQKGMWLKWLLIFSLGFLIFLISWWLYCAILGLPVLFPLKYTILARTGAFLFSPLYSRIVTIRNDIFWLSPFFLFLAALSLFERVRNFMKIKRAEPFDFIAILGVIAAVFYTALIPTTVLPKYIVILVPLFSMLIAPLLYEKISGIGKKYLWVFCLVSLLFFIYYFRLLPDPLLILLNRQGSVTCKVSLMLAYVLPLFFLGPVLKRMKGLKFNSLLAASALVLLVPSSASLSLKQALGDYATFYHYGERGLKETISYIKNNIDREEVVFGRKEFEYYLPNKVYFDRTGSTTILQGLLDDKKISYVIFSDYYEGDKAIKDKLDRAYRKIYSSGNFNIYKVTDKTGVLE